MLATPLHDNVSNINCSADSATPLVSIITPTQNSSITLPDTIRSVLAQTFTDWEWLIVDDYSTDQSGLIIEKLASENSKVKAFCLRKMGLALSPREFALRNARGRFMAFIDPDDVWIPTKLEHQIPFMLKHKAPLTYTAYRRINEDGSRIGAIVNIPRQLSHRTYLKNTAIACSTVMIDRNLTGNFSMSCVRNEDFGSWLSILRRGHKAYGLAEDLMYYRIRKGSASSNKWKSIRSVWRIYRQQENLPVLRAAYCLVNYGANALLKRVKF